MTLFCPAISARAWFALALTAVCLIASGSRAADDLLSPEQAFAFSARAVDQSTVEVRYRIAEGYYMYREKFRFSAQTAGVSLGKPDFPPGQPHEDEYFGKTETYRQDLVLRLPVSNAPSTGFTLQVIGQGCADAGLCYAPVKQTVQLTLAGEPALPLAKGPAPGLITELRRMAGAEPAAAVAGADFLPAEQAFAVEAQARDAKTVVVRFTPAPGYYLYRERLGFAAAGGVRVSRVSLPRGQPKKDPNLGQTEVFHDAFEALVSLDRPAGASAVVGLEVKYQGCSDKGLCYPPTQKTFQIAFAGGPSTAAEPARSHAAQEPSTGVALTPQPTIAGPVAVAAPAASTLPASPAADTDSGEDTRASRILRSGNFWWVLVSFFGFGLLLSLTPCVFPMIPILSGIIVGQGKAVDRLRAVVLSAVYVLGMALTYAAAGVAAGLSGTLLSNALQNIWVLGGFALVFVALSFSMFGYYDLQLPAALQSRFNDASNKVQGGHLGGVFVMGVLSALIVGPCVAAPLAGALLYISQTRDVVLGGSALFAMALGMGVPLMVVGVSAGALLPRAGGWMQAVKNFFGVLLLGLAIWIVSPVIPPAVHMLAWSVLLVVSAIHLHALDPLPERAGGVRKLWKGIGVLALLLGAALLVGALSGGTDLLQPLAGLRPAGAASAEVGRAPQFRRVKNVRELDQVLAASAGRVVLLDFYADWCVACKEMERYTFTSQPVRSRLERMALLQVDVTANTEEDTALLKRFGLYGPPGLIFFGGGKELPGRRVIGFQDAEHFAHSLDAALGGS